MKKKIIVARRYFQDEQVLLAAVISQAALDAIRAMPGNERTRRAIFPLHSFANTCNG